MLKRLCKILIMAVVLLMGIWLIYYSYATRLLSSDEIAEAKRLYDAKRPAQSEPTQSEQTRSRPTRERPTRERPTRSRPTRSRLNESEEKNE